LRTLTTPSRGVPK